MSYHGLTTVSRKKLKKDWIPRSSRGMTAVELIHATMPRGNDIY
ncbi:hypothetical protein [Candidatus Rickettsia colombianensi]|nr:hypothetical protein [Candidatus Rickettsia colombianensi]